MERLAADPHYFAKPDRALFQDIRRYFPITVQAQVAWAVNEGVGAAVEFIEEQIEAGTFEGGVAHCHATTRKGKPCQRTPLPERDYCPSHQHLERSQRRGLTIRTWRECSPAAGCKLGARMSHDTDKLIRQLSLVAFLMAERRPLTARDIKSNVEGYQEMSDEAFARRFYSDRAELVALGVPLDSQRDEYTGEELYTLRSERYFLPPLELEDDELAALQTCLYLLEGRFAYAEPLRLALQNLALGRSSGALDDAPTANAVRVEVRDPDYTPELQGRLGKLEGAISKQRTVKFRYWSIFRDELRERELNPYALLPENGTWYVIGEDQEDKVVKNFRVSRHPLRHPLRVAARARLPDARGLRHRGVPRPRRLAVRQGRGRGADRGGAGHRVVARARLRRPAEPASRTTSSSPSTRRCRCSRAGSSARTAAPCRSSRRRSAGSSSRARAPRATRTTGRRRRRPRRRRRARARGAERAAVRAGRARALRRPPVAARLPPDRVRRGARGRHPGARPDRAASRSRRRRSRSTCRCSTSSTSAAAATPSTPSCAATRCTSTRSSSATRSGGAPRLTPLEARAIRLALEFVGPMIAAGTHSPLDRVRAKLEETFGAFDLDADARAARRRRGGSRRDAHAGDRRAPRRRARVPQAGVDRGDDADGRAVLDRAPAAALVRPHLGSRPRPAAQLPPRPDEEREAAAEAASRPRAGFDRSELHDATTARIWYSPAVARWEVEKGADAARRRLRAARSARSEARVARSARCSRSAARRSCSSRPTSAHASPTARASSSACSAARRRRTGERSPRLRGRQRQGEGRPARDATRPRACRRAPRRSSAR